jgi:hypothetical protein
VNLGGKECYEPDELPTALSRDLIPKTTFLALNFRLIIPTVLFRTANIQSFLISTIINLINIIVQCYLPENLLILN